ncbi:MAG TPA: tetratricopeptide repeat protein, partial [Thiotrichales bacterium]|nr:tetratricopeptide repeat protein [Thiotrichales bacterium]
MNNAEIETQVQTAARLFQAGDIARADSLLSTVTQQADNHSGAWLLLARVKQKAGQRQAAVDAFQQLLRLNPGMEEAVLALVQHHGEKQEFDQCEQLLRDAIDARPDIARYPYMLGNLYLQQGYHANGIEQMKKAMSIAPDNLQIQVALAEMH